MDAGTVILILSVALIATGVAGHLIARKLRPLRRQLRRERAHAIEAEAKELSRQEELEDVLGVGSEPRADQTAAQAAPQAAAQVAALAAQAEELEARAHHLRLDAEHAEEDARRLRRAATGEPPVASGSIAQRRRAGIAPEDMDY